MKALLISCFGCEDRTMLVRDELSKKGFNVYQIYSDYDHLKKAIISKRKKEIIYVSVPQYQKNLSLKRIYSHIVFSANVKKITEQIRPDLIYALIPPNSLTEMLSQYKKKSKNCHLIFDIYDLWPESLPVGSLKKIFGLWGWIRNRNLKAADYIFLECNSYKKYVAEYINCKYDVLYLFKNQYSKKRLKIENIREINFCYLGSVNYLIDSRTMVDLLSNINKKKPVFLHLIGMGEGMVKLKILLEQEHIPYKDHGILFEEKKKDEIFRQCMYGINMYKNGTAIGLTMKSLEYFQAGLPVITSNISDTEFLVKKYGAGIIVQKNRIISAADEVINTNIDKWMNLHKNTLRLYKENFSEEIFREKIRQSLREIF